jgi:hypothetical protein
MLGQVRKASADRRSAMGYYPDMEFEEAVVEYGGNGGGKVEFGGRGEYSGGAGRFGMGEIGKAGGTRRIFPKTN